VRYQWILFDADETLFHFDAFKGLQLMFPASSISLMPTNISIINLLISHFGNNISRAK